jgi:hypothetical protein
MAKLDWNIDPERSDRETWISPIGRVWYDEREGVEPGFVFTDNHGVDNVLPARSLEEAFDEAESSSTIS